MDKIRNKLSVNDTILPIPYWNVTKSGKVLELRVKPSIDRQPAKYRLGIIQIGRIISRIQTIADQSGSRPQIQLFPNLSENQLAATIFWPGFLECVQKIEHEENHRSPLSDLDFKDAARHYDLSLTDDRSLMSDDEISSAYFVESKSNQPFIWLKLGQFIQDVTEQVDASPEACEVTIDILKTELPDRTHSHHAEHYRQAKIYIKRKPQNAG